MPTICARLGMFMLTRYFSMKSPSCFCAPAAAPPAWFMVLLNSGDVIARLAKALNPFSISPSIFCQSATGSLPLSVMDRLLSRASSFLPYHTVVAGRSTSLGGSRRKVRKTFCDARNRAIELRSKPKIPREHHREPSCPSAAAACPRQRHRHLLRDFRRRHGGADPPDHGARRPDGTLG